VVANQGAGPAAPAHAAGSSPPVGEAVRHRRLQANGIGVHVAEAGSGPLVVLLHGFPELWYSWRHQLPVLAAAGYHAVAPDLRGYGGTDASAADEGYAPSNMAADVVGLLDALGAGQAVLAGHDWGANIAWACAELFPQRVAGLVALSVPYRPRTPAPPSEVLRQFLPEGATPSPYPLGVTEAELQADARRSLRLFLYALSGDAPPGLVPRLFKQPAPPGRVLDTMPEPDALPAWLDADDLGQYAQAYARTGFRGPLGVYRNQDRDWHEHPEIGTAGVRQPALFIGGRRDPAVLFGKLEPMEAAVPNLRRIVLFPNCGHWTQQERPADVNDELLAFLQRQQRP
jgi:pimeloyl-ACP methyl ester carboxylesterase